MEWGGGAFYDALPETYNDPLATIVCRKICGFCGEWSLRSLRCCSGVVVVVVVVVVGGSSEVLELGAGWAGERGAEGGFL